MIPNFYPCNKTVIAIPLLILTQMKVCEASLDIYIIYVNKVDSFEIEPVLPHLVSDRRYHGKLGLPVKDANDLISS